MKLANEIRGSKGADAFFDDELVDGDVHGAS
jgi:hypothetical protein